MPANMTSFGPQASSARKTSPAFGFGAASRAVAQKVFVSQEHTALATAGTQSPGPAVYLLPPSVGGKQPDGRKKDPPVWGFGTASRFRSMSNPQVPGPNAYSLQHVGGAGAVQHQGGMRTEPQYGFGSAERHHVRRVFISTAHQKTDMHGLDSPGPAVNYQIPPSVGGKWPLGDRRTEPSYAIASKARPPDGSDKASPGPAAYTLPQSIGPQVDSRKPHGGTATLGAGTRATREKIYLGPNHAQGDYGKGSPGPAAPYALRASVGPQVDSRMREAPRPSFSKNDRWATYNKELKANTTPGPGAY